jgi:hypothetical protein
MIRGAKNGFFSITSVLFQGKNSNWNIHFTITITCTDKTVTDDLGNGSNYISTIITHRTTKCNWKQWQILTRSYTGLIVRQQKRTCIFQMFPVQWFIKLSVLYNYCGKVVAIFASVTPHKTNCSRYNLCVVEACKGQLFFQS